MKVIKVLSLLIRLDGGGAERSVSRLVAPLREYNVELLRYAIDPALPGEEADPHRTLTKGKARGIFRVFSAALSFARVVRRQRPDVVHLNCEAPELVGLLSRVMTPFRRYGVVVTEHSMKSWSGPRRTLGIALRLALRKLGALYVNCFKAESDEAGTSVIFNPTGKAEQLPAALGSAPRLMVVGRLIESKRVDQIFEAARLCEWPHRIVVVGEGSAANDLRAAASRWKLDVEFLGHQKNPWGSATMADIFVTASAYEGEPLTLIEAIQRQLPVIASEIPGHVRVLGEHVGLFATTQELSSLLADCIDGESTEKFRVCAQSRFEILEERDPQNISKKWRRIYEEVLVGKATHE